MIDEMLIWINAQRTRLEGNGTSINAARTKGRLDVAHINLDSGNKLILGQIIVWERGFCDVDILDVRSAQSILLEHHEPNSLEELTPIVEKVVRFVDSAALTNN
jgi:hypothetical protein